MDTCELSQISGTTKTIATVKYAARGLGKYVPVFNAKNARNKVEGITQDLLDCQVHGIITLSVAVFNLAQNGADVNTAISDNLKPLQVIDGMYDRKFAAQSRPD